MPKGSAKQEVELLKNQLARALADYDNLRKRVESEKQEFVKIASLNLVIKILPILDQLERAQEYLKDAGLAITTQSLKAILEEEGVEKIKVGKGDKFDANRHEAIEVAEGGKTDTISEVVMDGWKFTEGPVIRHAKVRVYK